MPDGSPGSSGTRKDRNPLSDPVGLREPGGVRRQDVLAGMGAAVLAGCNRSATRPVGRHGHRAPSHGGPGVQRGAVPQRTFHRRDAAGGPGPLDGADAVLPPTT